MKTQPSTPAEMDTSHLTPDLVLRMVSHMIARYPCGIACHPSQNSLHQIIEEIPATLHLAKGELVAIAPPLSEKGPMIASLTKVAWHFTDEDGRVHVTLSGAPELRRNGADIVIPELSKSHQELVIARAERLLGPDILATKLHSIRFEIPSRDLNVLIEVDTDFDPKGHAPNLALAS